MNSAYGTAKVALNQFTRHLAAELAGTGVTANVLHPGDVKTDMWADIRDRVIAAGPSAEAYEQWVRWVDETGGDPPHKAVDAVLALCDDAAARHLRAVPLDRRSATAADPELGHGGRRAAVDRRRRSRRRRERRSGGDQAGRRRTCSAVDLADRRYPDQRHRPA